MAPKKTQRLGERNVNKQGMLMEITKYYNNKDMVVTFVDTGDTARCRYDQFKKGNVFVPIKKSSVIVGLLAVVGVIGIAITLAVCVVKHLLS